MSAITTFLAFAGHCAALLQQHSVPLIKYGLVWLILHVFFEFVAPLIPAMRPVYTALNPDGKLSARAIAKDIRTKAICIFMAVWVVVLCAQGLSTKEGWTMIADHHGSSGISFNLVYIALSFFIWDIFVCIADREPLLFWVHAFASFFTFLVALQPLSQGMASVVLLQETSTIFLHLRKYAIQAGRTDTAFFKVVNVTFGLTFVLFRIVVGYTSCFFWAQRALQHSALPVGQHAPLLTSHDPSELLASPTTIALRIQMTTCIILASMNAFWFTQILSTLFCRPSAIEGDKAAAGVPAKGKKGAAAPSKRGERSLSMGELDLPGEFPPAMPRKPKQA